MKPLDDEGIDAGVFTVELVLVGVAVRLGTDCTEGALGMVGIP